MWGRAWGSSPMVWPVPPALLAVAGLGALARQPGAAVWYAFPWAEGVREA